MDAEEVVMHNANLEAMGQKAAGGHGGMTDDDGDEDMGDGRSRVQCARQ
jgi:hypothetical protein